MIEWLPICGNMRFCALLTQHEHLTTYFEECQEWKDIKYVSDNLSWIDIAYELGEDNKLTQKLDIEKYYGELSEGTYRIVKPIYDNGYVYMYSNEFEIK